MIGSLCYYLQTINFAEYFVWITESNPAVFSSEVPNRSITFISIELNQSDVKKEDEFDLVKEQQDHVLEEMVPKMNKEATKLSDVYTISDLIDIEVLDSLKADAITVLKANPDDLP